jgi:trans-aconitate methyltransferase
MLTSNRDIARRYLPRHAHYYYAWSKLATDPLYAGVTDALDGTSAPLLDLGCGIGLLAHALRARGFSADYHGIDVDAGKLASARAASARAGLRSVRFDAVDLANGFPAHRGSVTMLDVLQFLPPAVHKALLDSAIDCLTPGAHLVIRTGLHQENWRMRLTRSVDHLSHWWGWMNAGPQRYPTRADLEAHFAARGLVATFRPLHGRIPFENWLIVATRPEEHRP